MTEEGPLSAAMAVPKPSTEPAAAAGDGPQIPMIGEIQGPIFQGYFGSSALRPERCQDGVGAAIKCHV